MATPTAHSLPFRVTPDAPEPYTYDHIPALRELLPTNGGRPGVTYLQVAHEHRPEVERLGYSQIARTKLYHIVGPNGRITCALYGWGEPIPGADPLSGARICEVDAKLEWATGLQMDESKQRRVHITKPPERTEPAVKPSPSSPGGNKLPNPKAVLTNTQ